MGLLTMGHWKQAPLVLALLFALAACSTPYGGRVAEPSPHYKIGKPYKVNGRWYRPEEDPDYVEVGVASWYGRDFHGKKTANGEIYDMNLMSAAHTTLPMPSMVEVTNLNNGRKVVVRVNDRGPFARNRIIDLSRAAARRLGFEQDGLARVKVRYVGRAPLQAKASRPGGRVARTVPAPQEPQRIMQPVNASVTASASPESPQTLELLAAINENAPVSEPIADAAVPAPPLDAPSSVTLAAAPVEQPAPQAGLAALYVIRVAALSRLDNLERLKEQLEPIGPLRLSRVENDAGAVFYRVNMGPFASLDLANERLEAVRGAGYDDAGLVALAP